MTKTNSEKTVKELFESYGLEREIYLACNCRSGSCGVCLHLENKMQQIIQEVKSQVREETMKEVLKELRQCNFLVDTITVYRGFRDWVIKESNPRGD